MTSQEHHLGEDLAAMADGGDALTPARRAELEAHLATCAACRRAVDEAKLVFGIVERELAPTLPTQAFDARLFQRLDEIDREEARASKKAATRASFLDRLAALFSGPRLAFAIGSALAILLVVVTLAGRAPMPGAGRETEVAEVPTELGENVEALAFAEDLDLYQDLEVVEDLDVLDDLELIEHLSEGEPG